MPGLLEATTSTSIQLESKRGSRCVGLREPARRQRVVAFKGARREHAADGGVFVLQIEADKELWFEPSCQRVGLEEAAGGSMVISEDPSRSSSGSALMPATIRSASGSSVSGETSMESPSTARRRLMLW